MKTVPIGDCKSIELIEDIFGSVSEFARQIELKGNNFQYGEYLVTLTKMKTLIHFSLKHYFNADMVKLARHSGLKSH